MLQALSILKSSGYSLRRKTEGFVFYLHYRVTFLLLMFVCLLISTKEFIGEKIQCLATPGSEVTPAVLNAYCWAASTYSVSSAYLQEAGIETPHPGVGVSEDESDYTYRNYYQYVHLVLFIQALLFYIPHFIWKCVDETRLIKYQDVISACNIEESKKRDRYEAAAAYIEERWNTNKGYALKYILCELFALANLMIQSYMLDIFLHGEFLELGQFYISHYNATRMKDPIRIFPLVTNCYFKRFGPSGFVDTTDALCVLPINALNVKIYLFVWVWFTGLMGLTLLSVLNLGLNWLIPQYRTVFARLSSAFQCHSRADSTAYLNVMSAGDVGDWFVLSCIRNNMDLLEFTKLMETLCEKISMLGVETKESLVQMEMKET